MHETGSGLDPETERRIREAFAGQTCRRCGRPACRVRGGEFFCRDHVPPREGAGAASVPRVYRVSRGRD